MKKLLTIVAICLLCFSQSQARMNLMVLGGQTPAAPAGESYVLYWNGDDCTGNDRRDAKLSTGSCDITGTLGTGAEIINTDESNYYFYYTALNEYLRFTISSITNFDMDEFYIRLLVKPDTNTAGNTTIIEAVYDASNRFYALVNGSNGQVTMTHTGNGTVSNNVGNDSSVEALQYGYWGVVELKYSTTNSVIGIRVCSTAGADCLTCSGSEPWDTTTDTGHTGYEDMATVPTTIALGEDGSSSFTNATRISELEIRTYAQAP